MLIDFLMAPFGRNLTSLLIGSMFLGSALEWLAGFLLEKLFHQKWWDYSDQPHNLNGYICLRFSVLWAFAGALVVRYIMPRGLAAVLPDPPAPGLGAAGGAGGLVPGGLCGDSRGPGGPQPEAAEPGVRHQPAADGLG